MQKEKTQGLLLRGTVYHIDLRLPEAPNGRLRESTGKSDLNEAITVMHNRVEEIKDARKKGIRPTRLFIEAATKYLNENSHKRSIACDAYHLKTLIPYIGKLPIKRIHDATLESFIAARRTKVKNSTINRALEIVRRILKLASTTWIDEFDLTWMDQTPHITMLDDNSDARPSYPLHLHEQNTLLAELPEYLVQMTLFKLNTGLREQEVCKLHWSWEQQVPELDTSIFIIPGEFRKSRKPRVVFLNDIAKKIITKRRGKNDKFVFSNNGKPLRKMNNTTWKQARIHAALDMICDKKEFTAIEISSRQTRTSYLAIIKFRRENKATLISCYSLAIHEQDRLDSGNDPIKRSRRFAYDTRQLIRYKALLRAIDNFWPEYSEFARTRVHDIRHTCGRRLRAAKVPVETRAIILGHAVDDITTHYSAAEYQELIDAVQLICNRDKDSHVMNVTRIPYTKPKYGRRANR